MISSALLFSALTPERMSAAANTAETTAKPAMPPPRSCGMLENVIPPMAAAGMETAAQMARSCAAVMRMAFVLVGEGHR